MKQTPETQGSSADSGFGPSGDGDTVSITSYREIEESIYDDPSSFKPPEDYGLYAKKANEGKDLSRIFYTPHTCLRGIYESFLSVCLFSHSSVFLAT